MTTTQTIDGVPRELLQELRNVCGDPGLAEDVRALLDAPACPDCKVCVGSPLLPKGCTIDNGQHDPAAQPQGEPEAWTTSKPKAPGAYWIRGFNLSGEFTESALVQVALEGDEQVLMVNLHQSTTEKDTAYWYEVGDINSNFEWLGPLYAEQPAAVAVVLPERREVAGEGGHAYYIPVGWNACLDEVTRLNAKPR